LTPNKINNRFIVYCTWILHKPQLINKCQEWVFNHAILTPILKTAISVIQADCIALTYMSFICLLEFAEMANESTISKINGLVLVQY